MKALSLRAREICAETGKASVEAYFIPVPHRWTAEPLAPAPRSERENAQTHSRENAAARTVRQVSLESRKIELLAPSTVELPVKREPGLMI